MTKHREIQTLLDKLILKLHIKAKILKILRIVSKKMLVRKEITLREY